MYNFNIIQIIVIIILTIVIYINVINTNNKKTISKSLIIFWDIHCKLSIIKYLNNNDIDYQIIDYRDDICITLKVGNNFYCLMERHPQQYTNISILLNTIIILCNKLKINNIIGISTAGSEEYKIGDVLQFNSAYIQNYKEYSLDVDYIEAKDILYKTSNFIDKPINDTKGFIKPKKGESASGEDEFVVYFISNILKIPSLTLTGISDQNNSYQYNNGGGQLAAENTVKFLYNNFNLL